MNEHSPSSTSIPPQGSAKIVHDYDLFCEGDVEPHLGKSICCLVFKTRKFIVYLDDGLEVQWAFAPEYGDPAKEAGRILNQVSEIQAAPVSHLSKEQIRSIRVLLGEAVARILSHSDDSAAQDALDRASAILADRNTEISRAWYLTGSVWSTCAIGGAALILWLFRTWVQPCIGDAAFWIAMGASAGSIGAFLSVLVGSKNVPSEPSASKYIHHFAGISRILAGTIGALFIALGVKAEIFLSPIVDSVHAHELLLLVCMAAGISERLVPNLVEKIDVDTRKSVNFH